MQFNLVNDQEQVSQFVQHDVALHCMALALGLLVLQGKGRVPAVLVTWACISPWGAFPGCLWAVLAVGGSFAH